MITGTLQSSYVLTQAAHDAFVAISGDRNPVHTDAVYARRLLFGGLVVHGVHLVLRAMETYMEANPQPVSLLSLEARFLSSSQPDETVNIEIDASEEQSSGSPVEKVVCRLSGTDGRKLLKLRFHATTAITVSSDLPEDDSPPKICMKVPAHAIASARGSLRLFLNAPLAHTLFPALCAQLPPEQLATVLATTYLVGMRLPGYHSIFAGLSLCFSQPYIPRSELHYRTEDFSPERRFCRVGLSSPGARGHVDTFVRPEPATQPGLKDIRKLLEPGIFKGQRALVIGGSRGLGLYERIERHR